MVNSGALSIWDLNIVYLRLGTNALYIMKILLFLFIGLLSASFLTGQMSGTLDLTFGDNGITLTDIGGDEDGCRASAIQADGKIILGGYSYDGNNNIFAFARYLSDGSLDNTFGTTGIVTMTISESGGELFDLIIQPDGKIVAVGYTYTDIWTMVAVRLNADGSPDLTFDEDGILTINVGPDYTSYGMTATLQDDGKIIAAGYAIHSSTDEVNCACCRLNPDGTIDDTFGLNGILIWDILSMDNYINNVAMQGDKIIVGGVSYDDSGIGHLVLARRNSDGSGDNSFGNQGLISTELDIDWYTDAPVGSMCMDDQQRIIYGCYTHGTESDDFVTYRFTPDGLADPTFGNDGIAITQTDGNTYIHASMAQYDEKIIAGGYQWIEDHGDFAMIRELENGSPDASFGTDGTGVVYTNASPGIDDDNRIYSLAMQADGMVIAAGHAYQPGSNMDFAIARYFSGLDVGIGENENKTMAVNIYPNPVKDQFGISFALEQASKVKAEVVNTNGQTVALITNMFFLEGKHQLRWNAEGLPEGVYVIRMTIENEVYTSRIIKTH